MRPLFAILVFAASATLVGAAPPSLKDVLQRMTTYVDAYGDKASIVVCSEHYTQDVKGFKDENNPTVQTTHRELVADFAIVKTEEHVWVGYRDVIEVDGQRIADRDDRLAALLQTGGFDELQRVSSDSARFNIGPVTRNFNVPTAELFFFTAANRDRFRFAMKACASDGACQIDFEERSKPTLVRTPDGESVPSSGSLWVDPADGTIERTLAHFRLADRSTHTPAYLTVEIDVRYQRVAALGMWLPSSMTELYRSDHAYQTESISTSARYSNYRTFQTSARIK